MHTIRCPLDVCCSTWRQLVALMYKTERRRRRRRRIYSYSTIL